MVVKASYDARVISVGGRDLKSQRENWKSAQHKSRQIAEAKTAAVVNDTPPQTPEASIVEHDGEWHICTMKHQFRVLHDLKNILRPSDIVVHMDFSENWSCKYENEVQSMHFGAKREQATIHDGVIYVDGQVKSFATISNSNRHDAVAIWLYLTPIFQWILNEKPEIDTVHFITDGPTTQYRNKTFFYMIRSYFMD